MVKRVDPTGIESLQKAALELSEVMKGVNHARQTYIATGRDDDRKVWMDALRDEKQCWDRYWHAHRQALPGID